MPANFGPYQPFTGFSVVDPNTNVTQDLGQRYITKSYLLDTYPNIASQLGSRTSSGLWGWGSDGYGQGLLVNGTTNIKYSSPLQIGSLTNWKQISCGGTNFVSAVKIDGTLWSWGSNDSGKLGISTAISTNSPIQVGTGTNWQQVSCGNVFAAAIRTDGSLWTWGYSGGGSLGNNLANGISYSSPIQITSAVPWKQVVCSNYYSAAIKIDGSLWMWGSNLFGNLGDGTTTNASTPIQVGTSTNWKQVSCGYGNSVMAIKQDGTMWAWGQNIYGQLGVNISAVSYSSPLQVGTSTTWKQVDINNFFMAVKTDGSLWTCGYSAGIYYSSPIQVGSLTNWKTVSIKNNIISVAAIKTDGTLWTWGYNVAGQLGNNTTIFYSSPIQVGSLTTWKQVTTGPSFTFGISDGYI